jgi:uncharacterized protein YlxW (UPF0749 family)
MRAAGAMEIGLLLTTATLSLVALVLVFAAILAQRRLRKTLRVTRGIRGNELLLALREHGDDLDALETAVIDLQARVASMEDDVALCTSRVAMVHYDAFPDMGGKLSFSLAMLDEQGDGIVLSIINGRSETRVWGKRVIAGSSRQRLSDEESRVLEQALVVERRRPDDAVPGDGR